MTNEIGMDRDNGHIQIIIFGAPTEIFHAVRRAVSFLGNLKLLGFALFIVFHGSASIAQNYASGPFFFPLAVF
jgi:hypothetical protein